MIRLFCAVAFAAALNAQTGPGAVGGPLLGAVFDPVRGAVRFLTGIPASATLGDVLDSGAPLKYAAVSAAGFAVGVESASGAVVIVSSAGRRPLPGVPGGASSIALSPRGTTAAIYFKDSLTAYVVTGLPDSPAAPRQVGLDRQPATLAVSDDGSALLSVERIGRGGATVLLHRDGATPAVLRSSPRIAEADFIPGSSDALIAEDDAVYVVSESFGPQLIAGPGDGIGGVAAAASSADGSRVIIAMRSGQVAVRDRKTSAQSMVSCACQPAGLARLRGTSVFRLNDIASEPLWILDADSGDPRILFVAGAKQ
jgi:hypothetical protein